MKMNAIIKPAREKGLEMVQKEIPTIKYGEALVKIHYTAICGTDVHIYDWNEWAQKTINPPMTIGHEFVGEIVEITGVSIDIHLGGIQIAFDGHGDVAGCGLERDGSGGDGCETPFECECNRLGVDFVNSHAGGIEITAVITQRIPGALIQSIVPDFKHNDVAGFNIVAGGKNKQILFAVHNGEVHIVGMAQIGKGSGAVGTVFHQTGTAGILVNAVDHGIGVVSLDHGGVQIGAAGRKSLGRGASVCLMQGWGDLGVCIVIQNVGGIGGDGNQTGRQQQKGADEKNEKTR